MTSKLAHYNPITDEIAINLGELRKEWGMSIFPYLYAMLHEYRHYTNPEDEEEVVHKWAKSMLFTIAKNNFGKEIIDMRAERAELRKSLLKAAMGGAGI